MRSATSPEQVIALQPTLREKVWDRIDGVDLLRGLSILFVLSDHVNMRLLGAKVRYLQGIPDQLAYTLVWNGQAGVQMFFVISGYLITSTSMRRWKEPPALRVGGFYLLRFTRIAPLMVLLLVVLCGLHLAKVPDYVVSAKTGGLSRALMAALTFHIGYLEATTDYLPANWDILWSLSVEEMFYLFFPLMAKALRRQWLLVVLLACFVVAGPFARMKVFNPNPVWREYSYLGGMDAIALGCLTAMLLSSKQLTRAQTYLCGVAGSALLIFSLGCSLQAYRCGLGRNGLYFTVLATGVCFVILAATQSRWRAPRVFAPILELGRRSYEIYLTHMFVVMALFAGFVHLGKPLRGVPILFVSAVLTAGVLGLGVSVVYTVPMNRLIRRYGAVDTALLGSATPGVE